MACQLRQWLLSLPKVELHVHLDGAFDHDFLFHAAREKLETLPVEVESAVTGKAMPLKASLSSCKSLEEFEKLITCRGQRSLQAMLDCFSRFLPCVRGDMQGLEELSYRFVAAQAKQNIVYTEVRYSPHLLMDGEYFAEGGDDPEPAIAAVTRGLRRGCCEHGIIVNQILCCISFQASWSMPIIQLAEKYRSAYPCAVVGVDVAAGEVGDDPTEHADAFEKAKELGLKVTLHAGEVGGPDNVRHAAFDFHACRVGHGYAVASGEEDELLASLVSHGLHFEVCPTSSDETGAWRYDASAPPWSQHPVQRMLAAGASVSINSDDPSVFATTLTEELVLCVSEIGLSREQILQMTLCALDVAFCSNEEKLAVRQKIQKFMGKSGDTEKRINGY
eukprot:symbB.v1.2.027188.t1/scaffold2768.1/size73204/4